jgi:hypothetical protein
MNYIIIIIIERTPVSSSGAQSHGARMLGLPFVSTGNDARQRGYQGMPFGASQQGVPYQASHQGVPIAASPQVASSNTTSFHLFEPHSLNRETTPPVTRPQLVSSFQVSPIAKPPVPRQPHEVEQLFNPTHVELGGEHTVTPTTDCTTPETEQILTNLLQHLRSQDAPEITRRSS